MRICNKCQSPMGDNDLFCQSCGAKYEEPQSVSDQQPVQQPAQPVQQPAQPVQQYVQPVGQQYYQQPVQPVQPQYNAPRRQVQADPNMVAETHRTLKTIGKSPLFLIFIIVYTIMFLINFISIMTKLIDFNMPNMYTHFMNDDFGVNSYITNSISSIAIIISLVALIPSVLMTLGLWMTFGSAVSSSNRIKTGGLTIIKVLQIISLVGICVVSGIFAIALLIIVFAGLVSGETEAVAISFIMFIIVGGCLAFLIVLQAKVVTTISTIKKTVISGIPSDKVSRFVAVVSIISGVVSLIGAAITALSGAMMKELSSNIFGANELYGLSYEMNTMTILSIVSSVGSAVISIISGALIFNYRGAMQRLINKYYNCFAEQPAQYVGTPYQYAQNTQSVYNTDNTYNQNSVNKEFDQKTMDSVNNDNQFNNQQ